MTAPSARVWILYYLGHREEVCTVREIVRHSYISATQVNQAFHKLVQEGLVEALNGTQWRLTVKGVPWCPDQAPPQASLSGVARRVRSALQRGEATVHELVMQECGARRHVADALLFWDAQGQIKTSTRNNDRGPNGGSISRLFVWTGA